MKTLIYILLFSVLASCGTLKKNSTLSGRQNMDSLAFVSSVTEDVNIRIADSIIREIEDISRLRDVVSEEETTIVIYDTSRSDDEGNSPVLATVTKSRKTQSSSRDSIGRTKESNVSVKQESIGRDSTAAVTQTSRTEEVAVTESTDRKSTAWLFYAGAAVALLVVAGIYFLIRRFR